MIYLLDANVLIDANRDYYPFERIPEFWEWLVYHGESGRIKIPLEIYEELKSGTDELAEWTKLNEVKNALLLNEEVEVSLIKVVIDQGYAKDLSDIEVEKLGRDPFLIAYALKDTAGRSIVTTEASRPGKSRANRHIPDVCETLQIPCFYSFKFFRRLNFSTNWKVLIDRGSE